MPLDITARVAGLERMKEDPTPTPIVGDAVHWFLGGHGEAQAAVVTRVLSPGIVDLTIFPPGGMPRTMSRVLYKKSDEAKKGTSPQVHRNGCWDYQPGKSIPKAHFQLHLAEIERRIAGLEDEKRRYDDAEVLKAEAAKKAAAVA